MTAVNGTPRNDLLNGTRDDDPISAFGGNDVVFGQDGNDGINGNGGNDRLLGDRGNDVIYGGTGNDSIFGGRGNDTIFGNGNEDILRGGPGDDRLLGNAGNDVLFGNRGLDTLTGGSGADIFAVQPSNSDALRPEADLITDFRDGEDLINLQGIEFAQLEITPDDNNIILRDRLTGEFIAILENVSPTAITAADFTTSGTPIPPTPPIGIMGDRAKVVNLEFLGEITFETGFSFQNTEVGGISGITYDPENNIYYALADDRSQTNDARFYTLTIDLDDNGLNDVTFTDVTTLRDENGEAFAINTIDPEGIVLQDGNLWISSEGVFPRDDNGNQLFDPFINKFDLEGQQTAVLPVPEKFLPTEDGTSGIRSNLAFQSLTVTPDGRFLYTATEGALVQDGPIADLENESPVRILKYDLQTGEPVGEFLYFTDPIPVPPNPPDDFSDNGLVGLVPLDNTGTLLALERSFAVGVGNNIRLYELRLQGATNIGDFDNLLVDPTDPEAGSFDVDQEGQKRLLLDFSDLGISLDNSEAIAFGPTLPDGRQTLIVISDNNFNDSQITQFLAFALDIDSIPAVAQTLETPAQTRIVDRGNPDLDDPAIYVHPSDPSASLVITAWKDAGLAVYDLQGRELQTILPADIRYNNVDVLYGFQLGNEIVDLAVASDRRNDTLAIFQIDPETRQLTDITAADIPETIFGIDDGERTVYGLTSYTSPISGTPYVFVTQRDGNLIAQLELVDNGTGEVNATPVRTLELPVPTGDPEDSQSEGIVADRERGLLYVAMEEEVGILRFNAEPDAGDDFTVIQPVDSDFLTPDIEGLALYYGPEGSGYLIASSQGDSTFAVFRREGNNEYLGSFVIGGEDDLDGVEESDGLDVINVPLGSEFPSGLLVVQDGSAEPPEIFQDPEDGEIQNFSTNFKFVDWAGVANAFSNPLGIYADSFDPRNPVPLNENFAASSATFPTETFLG